jgi:hypothetical protein
MGRQTLPGGVKAEDDKLHANGFNLLFTRVSVVVD